MVLLIIIVPFLKHPQGQAYSIEADILPDMASKGILRSVPLNTDFLDIGVPDDYLHFCKWIKEKKGFSL
ncbi:hypothetical protein N8141_01100 [Amylibacter sp.]|nr:hypothetical protein [Amylibacter sp.]